MVSVTTQRQQIMHHINWRQIFRFLTPRSDRFVNYTYIFKSRQVTRLKKNYQQGGLDVTPNFSGLVSTEIVLKMDVISILSSTNIVF